LKFLTSPAEHGKTKHHGRLLQLNNSKESISV
jgi:hypothetical protein